MGLYWHSYSGPHNVESNPVSGLVLSNARSLKQTHQVLSHFQDIFNEFDADNVLPTVVLCINYVQPESLRTEPVSTLSQKFYLDIHNLGVSIPRSPNSVSQTQMLIRVWVFKMKEADQVLEKIYIH